MPRAPSFSHLTRLRELRAQSRVAPSLSPLAIQSPRSPRILKNRLNAAAIGARAYSMRHRKVLMAPASGSSGSSHSSACSSTGTASGAQAARSQPLASRGANGLNAGGVAPRAAPRQVMRVAPRQARSRSNLISMAAPRQSIAQLYRQMAVAR